MASHHHHHNHPTTCCCSCRCASLSHPTDPLLQAIAIHLLQSPQSHHLKPQQQQLQQTQKQQTQSLFSSLFHRIDALESSLYRLSVSRPSYSLRDTAARIIQTHFRVFLVRRSRSLRHLKDLAVIKSSLNSLKCSLSDNTHVSSEVLSQKAMDLLFKLDSIQGGDSMIRDAKKAISRELIRFLDFLDGISLKRQELSSKARNHSRFSETSKDSRAFGSIYTPIRSREIVEHGFGANCQDRYSDQRAFGESLSDEVQEIRNFSRVSGNEDLHVELEGFHHISDDEEGSTVISNGIDGLSQAHNGVLVRRHELPSKVKKRVSFAQNGNLARVFINSHEPFPMGDAADSIDGGIHGYVQRETLNNLCNKVEEIESVSEDDEEINMENEEWPQSSNGEKRNPRKNWKTEANYGTGVQYQDQIETSAFSAPLPVLMEPRTDLSPMVKTKNAVRIVR